MGSLIGGVIGGIGSLFGGSSAASQANEGYNYLSKDAANQGAQTSGAAAGTAQQGTQGQISALLGTNPGGVPAAQTGFNNYLNSTGYQFQQQQGDQALTGSAAAKGLVGSGGTAKALTQFGQGLAGQSFNNYLTNLQGLNTSQQNTVNAGVTASGQVGQAGTQGGGNAAQQTASGIGGATAGLASVGENIFGNSNSNAGINPVALTPSNFSNGGANFFANY